MLSELQRLIALAVLADADLDAIEATIISPDLQERDPRPAVLDKLPVGAIANDREKGEEVTSFATRTRARSRLLAGEKLKGRVAVVTGGTRGSARRSVAAWLASRAGLGRRDGVACVVDFLCADVWSLIAGRLGAVDCGGEV